MNFSPERRPHRPWRLSSARERVRRAAAAGADRHRAAAPVVQPQAESPRAACSTTGRIARVRRRAEARRALGEVAVGDQRGEQARPRGRASTRSRAVRGSCRGTAIRAPGSSSPQLAPALEREQRVVGGRVDPAAEARAQPVDALDAAAQPGAHLARRAASGPGPTAATSTGSPRSTARDHLVDPPPRAGRRVVDERGARQALAHARACGEDDQVAGLEAAGDAVEVLEAGRGAGDRPCPRRRAARACRARPTGGRGSRGSPCGGRRGRPRGSRARRGRRARAAAPRGSARAPGSRRTRAGGGGASRSRATIRAYWRTLPTAGTEPASEVDRGAAADALELAGLLEVLDEREGVDRLADRVQVEHRLEDQAVRLAVEVLRLEALVDDQRGQRGVRQQDGAEDRLLRLEVLRRGGAVSPLRGLRSPSGDRVGARSFVARVPVCRVAVLAVRSTW